MEKYGSALFQKYDGYYRCFFTGCGKKLQANFSRHVAKHEQEGDSQDDALVKSVKESLPSEGVPTQHCANIRHQEFWGTNPELPVTEFYKRSHKCKKCYIRQQMERKRHRNNEPVQNGSLGMLGELDQTKSMDPSPKRRNKDAAEKHESPQQLKPPGNGPDGSTVSKQLTDELNPSHRTISPSADMQSVILTGNDSELGIEDKLETLPHDMNSIGTASGYVNAEFNGAFHVTGYLEGVGLTIQIALGGRDYKGFVVNQTPDTTTKSSYDKILESFNIGNDIIMSDIEVRQLVTVETTIPTSSNSGIVGDHNLNIIDSSVKDIDHMASDAFNNHI